MNPETNPQLKLTAEQVQQYRRDGFISIPRLVDDPTLAALRTEYDRFINREIDCGEHDRLLGGIIHQVMYPSRHSAFMRENPAVQTAKAITAQLVGAPAGSRIDVVFDMLIDKPAGTDKATPWHQDYASSKLPMAPVGKKIPENASLTFWVALDHVDVANGCMHFLPGLHTGPLLPHSIVGGNPKDHSRLLAMDHVDTAQAVVCPLTAGGCTIHHSGTPHYTGPNLTRDRNRRAYIFSVQRYQPEPLLERIKKLPKSWIVATTFLWLPVMLLGCAGLARWLFPETGGALGLVYLGMWSYPLACAIAAFLLFRFSRFPKALTRRMIIANLAAIPLWGLALYLYR